VLRHRDDYAAAGNVLERVDAEMVAFFRRHFSRNPQPAPAQEPRPRP